MVNIGVHKVPHVQKGFSSHHPTSSQPRLPLLRSPILHTPCTSSFPFCALRFSSLSLYSTLFTFHLPHIFRPQFFSFAWALPRMRPPHSPRFPSSRQFRSLVRLVRPDILCVCHPSPRGPLFTPYKKTKIFKSK